MNVAFRLLLTFNATSLLVITFLVQKSCTLEHIFPKFEFLQGLPNAISYIAYIVIPILLSGLSILLSPMLGKDSFTSSQIISIEHANNSFLPSYLGYFFVALSVGNWETLAFVYSVLFVFTYLSQALYFNPLFLLYGFEFYNITTKNGAAIFLISRQQFKTSAEVNVQKAYRINNFTFIERG